MDDSGFEILQAEARAIKGNSHQIEPMAVPSIDNKREEETKKSPTTSIHKEDNKEVEK